MNKFVFVILSALVINTTAQAASLYCGQVFNSAILRLTEDGAPVSAVVALGYGSSHLENCDVVSENNITCHRSYLMQGMKVTESASFHLNGDQSSVVVSTIHVPDIYNIDNTRALNNCKFSH